MKVDGSLRGLKGTREIGLLFKQGRRVKSGLLRAVFRKNSLGQIRLVLVTPRAVSKSAVVRNRIRRRAKEWLRRYRASLAPVDIALIFKKEATQITRKQFYEELERIIRKAGQ